MKLTTRSCSRRQFFRVTGQALMATGLCPLGSLVANEARNQAQDQQDSRFARGQAWAAATVHPLATDVAAQILRTGGNAIDAAVAASFMLSVVDGHNSGIGGGGFALLRTADGRYHAIDGREMAPSLIKPEMYFRNGKPDPTLSQTGPLAIGVPGLVAALEYLHTQWGKTSWEDLVNPAGKVASQGVVFGGLADVIRRVDPEISRFPETARILKPGGRLPDRMDTLYQPDLARTLGSIARAGAAGFYTGDVADRIATHVQQAGGMLSRKDMEDYQVKIRQPIESAYHDYRVVGFPPPSSGGIHLAQMLMMLEPFELTRIRGRSEADYLHLLAEVMRRAMADRAQWLGDSDYANVPSGLLNPDYLRERMSDFRFDQTTDQLEHGLPPGATSQFLGDRHTTHLTTADNQGNVVAITQTVNTSFGSKMIAPGTGVVLNNEMDDFAIAPGVRNAFGLVGTDANAIEPGKRPLSSMSPTIVVDANQQPIVTCGAAGGPRIITATLQNLLQVLDFQQPMDQAISAPRIHHQWSPNVLTLERSIDNNIVRDLEKRGHRIQQIDASATAQGISFGDNGLVAASDPRTDGKSIAQ